MLLRPSVVGFTDESREGSCAESRIEVQIGPPTSASLAVESASLSRAERAHYRLCWEKRLARNTRLATCGQVTIQLFGVPESFATSLGLPIA